MLIDKNMHPYKVNYSLLKLCLDNSEYFQLVSTLVSRHKWLKKH